MTPDQMTTTLQAIDALIPADRYPTTVLPDGILQIDHSNEDDYAQVYCRGDVWAGQWFDRDARPFSHFDLGLPADAAPAAVAAAILQMLSVDDPTCATCGCWGSHTTEECNPDVALS